VAHYKISGTQGQKTTALFSTLALVLHCGKEYGWFSGKRKQREFVLPKADANQSISQNQLI